MNKTPQQIIDLVNNSKSYIEVFEDLSTYDLTFIDYVKLIHPDLCKLPGAQEATAKLNKFKEDVEKGRIYKDDAGIVTSFPLSCTISGKEDLLRKSLDNYKTLLKFNSSKDEHFHKYLPKNIVLKDEKLNISFEHRAIPLSSVGILPQEHVNWILNRLLEFLTWLHNKGYSHSGINLDSVFIVPETHGIQVVSFYHMNKLGQSLKTISGRYKHFYPYIVFCDKTATSFTDIELSKRTAAVLLGDVSATGNLLKKTHNKDFVEFLLTYDIKDSFEVLKSYKELLSKNFEKKFFKLNI